MQYAIENDFDNGLLALGALIAGFEEYDRRQLVQLLLGHFDVDIPGGAGGALLCGINLRGIFQFCFQQLDRYCDCWIF